MKIYLVGGAVRDRLLNLPHIEKDWVVIGSTPEEMITLGFRPVGKDFPVFLHPHTHEEYALARTERKNGRGYKGFSFHASPDITLEEDLKRRDLTINAMAMDEKTQAVIDPYGGQKDLREKILRHVSPAFEEDPVRILRVARFMARFHQLGFSLAPETLKLMKAMVENGEVDALVPDRVWQEMDRALGEKNPEQFFEVLTLCGALEKLFPELSHSKLLKNNDKSIVFASLLLNINKQDIVNFCKRYPVPVEYKELALTANSIKNYFSKERLSSEEIIDLLEKADAFRREERFYKLLQLFKNTEAIKKAFELVKKVKAEEFIQQGFTGKAIGELMRKKRLELLR